MAAFFQAGRLQWSRKMKLIALTQGKFAKVDDEDFGVLSSCKWYLVTRENNIFYAINRSRVSMHRLILAATRNLQVDHINHDGLDNRRSNLRLCTHKENDRNRRLQRNNTSGFKGVSMVLKTGKWEAKVRYRDETGRVFNIVAGYFHDKRQAALAYNRKALEIFGKFAYLNKI